MAPGQKPFYIALGVVAVLGIGFIASRLRSGPAVSIPANIVVTTADTSGFRGYLLGSPSAPVEITEYADYGCPHCADFDQVQFPDLNTRLIIPGKARLRFRDFPIEGANSRVAAHAAACANDQGHFWDAKEGLFRRQTDWVLQANPMSVITQVVRATGLDVSAWNTCMQSAKYAGRIQASYNEGTKLGVNSTPSFLIAGRIYNSVSSDDIVKLVDSLAALAPHPSGATTPLGGP
ncbi:MAG: DsbA family protein [Gemmatimonadales bacterium]